MAEARRAEQLLVAEFRRFTEMKHDVDFMDLLSTGAYEHYLWRRFLHGNYCEALRF